MDEPTNEPSVRGPRDGFVENLSTNLSLLKRRIRTSQLKVETTTVGKLSRTKVAICYIKEVANDKTVGEVKKRLDKIQTDSILEGGYIEEFIADEPFTIFPLIQYTERPVRAAAALFEGRIAIIVDNTPHTLIVPCTVIALVQAAEDYYVNAPLATLIRVVRFIVLNVSLLLPAVTVAVLTFHQELLPISFLSSVAGAREICLFLFPWKFLQLKFSLNFWMKPEFAYPAQLARLSVR